MHPQMGTYHENLLCCLDKAPFIPVYSVRGINGVRQSRELENSWKETVRPSRYVSGWPELHYCCVLLGVEDEVDAGGGATGGVEVGAGGGAGGGENSAIRAYTACFSAPERDWKELGA